MPKPIFKTERVLDHIATGALAKAYRSKRGVTGLKLSQTMGIKQSVISKLENGKQCWNLDLFNRYCQTVDAIQAGDIPQN